MPKKPHVKNRQRTAPKDLLARAFLDILAREAGDISKPLLRSGDADDPIDKLLEDLAPAKAHVNRAALRPDIAAAAVLVARAIESEPGLVRELRRGAPVVTVAVHLPDLVPLVEKVMKSCAFGANTEVREGRSNSSYDRAALLVARDGTESSHKPEKGNEAVAAALHAHNPVVGIAADPRRHLPRDLMRASEYNLVLSQIDADALALVIEAVTGTPPQSRIDQDLVRAADVSDLQLALRRGRTPNECLTRLAEIVRKRGLFDAEGPRLEELAGYGEARQWGLDLAADIAAYRKGALEWAACEKGLLIAGPPGTGKTQFAKAVAKTAGCPIVATSVADWNSATYLSGTLAAMKTAFAQARRLAPSILFIDELDGISDRSKLGSDYAEYWSQIVNLLLELLAGVEERPGVVVIGATNHPDKIDPAVRRAGRLDRTITIEKPGIEDLIEIFRFHLKESLSDQDPLPAALSARGGTGADVEAWVRRAKGIARRAGRPLLLDDLLQVIRAGREALPQNLRKACAIHEAGHAVVAAAFGMFELHALSLHDAGGRTELAIKFEHSQTLRGLEATISGLLAGRAAEETLLGQAEITAGSGGGEESDLARATRLAADIEGRLGFGALGPIYLPDRAMDLIIHDTQFTALIKARLDRCFEQARAIVAENRVAVTAIAEALEKEGYLDKVELGTLLSLHLPGLPSLARAATVEQIGAADEGAVARCNDERSSQ